MVKDPKQEEQCNSLRQIDVFHLYRKMNYIISPLGNVEFPNSISNLNSTTISFRET